MKLPHFKIPNFRIPGIGSVLGGHELLGVDIGTTSIKAAEIRAGVNDQLTVTNYALLETFGYLERPNGALQASGLTLLESETARYLKILLAHSKFKTTQAMASLPSFSAFTTLLEIPAMADSEIGKIMTLQAKQYIPLPISQVTIDWQKVGERTDEHGLKKYQILLISVVNEQLARYQKIFEAAGLKLVALEVEGISLARALTRGVNEPALIVDIGSRSTGIAVAERGSFKFGGQTDFSGGSITQTIATSLNINIRRAEDLKKQKGLSGYGGDQELSTLMEPILDVIINEARRIKRNYETSYGGVVNQVILSGGGSNLVGIEKYFADQIALPVSKANPFEGLAVTPEIQSILKDLGPLLAVAVGLAIKPD